MTEPVQPAPQKTTEAEKYFKRKNDANKGCALMGILGLMIFIAYVTYQTLSTGPFNGASMLILGVVIIVLLVLGVLFLALKKTM